MPRKTDLTYPKNAIKPRRKALGMRQIDLAVAAEVSQSVVSDFESGRGWPTPENQMAIADVLGCAWLELWVDPSDPDLNIVAAGSSKEERARMAEVIKLVRVRDS